MYSVALQLRIKKIITVIIGKSIILIKRMLCWKKSQRTVQTRCHITTGMAQHGSLMRQLIIKIRMRESSSGSRSGKAGERSRDCDIAGRSH